MNNRLAHLLIVALAASAADAAAGEPSIKGGGIVDSRTHYVQEKAEQLFQSGDYKRAYIIYRNELAPIGDKYAQYMLGFMTLTGSGVPEDPVLASAWYRLAAERGAPEFVAVRDELLSRFDDVDLGRSDREYLALRRELSDIVLYLQLTRKVHERIAEGTTGSRIGGPSSAVTIFKPNEGATMSGDAYQLQLQRSLGKYLDLITEILEIEPLSPDMTKDQLDELEVQVMENVGRLDDREESAR